MDTTKIKGNTVDENMVNSYQIIYKCLIIKFKRLI